MSRFIFAASLALGFAVSGQAAFAQRNVAVPSALSAATSLPAGITHIVMKNDVIGANAPRHIVVASLPETAATGM